MGNAWDASYESNPTGASSIGRADDELRNLKENIRTILEKEHFFSRSNTMLDAGTNMVGRLREGAGRAFVSDEPPKGRFTGVVTSDNSVTEKVVPFTADDEGRLWYRTKTGVNAGTDSSVTVGGDGRFGLYVLQINGTKPEWWPVDNEVIGTTMVWFGTFVQPTEDNWYHTGTKPGWYALNGETVKLPQVANSVTLPNYGAYDPATKKGAPYISLAPSSENDKISNWNSGKVFPSTVGAGSNAQMLKTSDIPDHTHGINPNSLSAIAITNPYDAAPEEALPADNAPQTRKNWYGTTPLFPSSFKSGDSNYVVGHENASQVTLEHTHGFVWRRSGGAQRNEGKTSITFRSSQATTVGDNPVQSGVEVRPETLRGTLIMRMY